MPGTNCAHCSALLTPGAPFCLACWMPLEEPEPAAAAEPAAHVAQPVGAPAAGGAPPPGGDVWAPQFVSHPGEGADWRFATPQAALLTTRQPAQRSRVPLVAGVAVLLAALVGGGLFVKSAFSKPSTEQRFAKQFREGRPPDFLPSMPDMFSPGDYGTESKYDPKTYVEAIDARIRAGNEGLVTLQRTLDSWADGKATDDEVRRGVEALLKQLQAVVTTDMLVEAPEETQRGLSKMLEASTEYRLGLGALLSWLDSGGNGNWITFRLSIGSANVNWDAGVVGIYRSAGLPPPPLPHPQRND